MIFPDISRYQGTPNFDVMKSKTDYVILKATQGNFIDSQFTRNRNECERVGLSYGIYHFYDDRRSPALQAETLYNALLDHPLPAEIWCDWENLSHIGDRPYRSLKDVVAFMERVELLTGRIVGMYTGYYWFVENSDSIINDSQYRYLALRPLWLAWYTPDFTNNGIEKVKIPAPWHEMEIWQFGTPSLGYSYGVQSIEIDMNERFDGTLPEPPPTGETMAQYEVISTLYNMSLRPDHNTGAQGTEWVPKNTLMKADEIWTATADLYKLINGVNVKINSVNDKWAHIVSVGGVAKNAWTAVVHLGVVYCTVKEIAAPPTPPEPVPATPPINVNVNWDGTKYVLTVNGVEVPFPQ